MIVWKLIILGIYLERSKWCIYFQ